MIAFASSLDQGGPMAQTAEDCGLLLNAMVGFDEKIPPRWIANGISIAT
jgi:aspartyl-tRNA(Asn)/glutamyl-tRNA(Gln) amidotransferase subunit A